MKPPLLLGVARENITPPLGTQLFGYHPGVFAQEVHDPLTLTAFVFRQGDVTALMISAFVCTFDTELFFPLRTQLETAFGIPADHIILSALHTHCGPSLDSVADMGGIDYPYYETVFRPALFRATQTALDTLEPVQVAAASGTSLVGINRRQLNPNNTITLGQNPWGTFNPEMYLLSFRTEKQVLANIIWYGAHLTAAGCIPVITRDWAGPMVDGLEAASGAITAFFNGPEGDVGPRLTNGRTMGDLSHVAQLGHRAAADALRLYTQLGPYQTASLAAGSADLKLPVKPRISYEEARKGFDPSVDSTNPLPTMPARQNNYYQKVMDSYGNGYTDRKHRNVLQTLIQIGNVVFAAFPMELFSEIGMRIDAAAGDKKVLSLSNSNGMYSYFPTQDQMCRGGYEVGMFRYLYGHIQPWVDDVDHHIVSQTLEHIAELNQNHA